MRRIHSDIPAGRLATADFSVRGVPEDEDDEDDGEESGEDEEDSEKDDDQGEGYSE